ncbi:hypothetical protein C5Y96_16100 [Blastopirellula marina]|uniref:RHS repeat-associated core domain-containing protein n=1 Tax=Blastopirellula marina TaxID=124 RepID=A0A2S8F8B6_9BACT|nr:hypothetical protein C5Y96_16100 [Blastopirellula marina]RCS49114.1 hypothetical protein DTL36_16120 [Bremerella cremea]
MVRNRVYHPKLGRWLTKDPLGMVDGPNLYEYCAGDPVNLIDPSGGYAESVWDAFSFGVGLTSLAYNWQHGTTTDVVVDLLGLTADALAIALPFIPGGAGAAIKAIRAGNAISDYSIQTRQVARWLSTTIDITQTGDITANGYQSIESLREGDYWGAALGGLHTGVRAGQFRANYLKRARGDQRLLWETKHGRSKSLEWKDVRTRMNRRLGRSDRTNPVHWPTSAPQDWHHGVIAHRHIRLLTQIIEPYLPGLARAIQKFGHSNAKLLTKSRHAIADPYVKGYNVPWYARGITLGRGFAIGSPYSTWVGLSPVQRAWGVVAAAQVGYGAYYLTDLAISPFLGED